MIPTTVDEIRSELIKLGESEANVAAMKKSDLKARLIELYNKRTDEDMTFTMENINEESSETVEKSIGVRYASPEWSDYVMGLFQQDELIAGYPKINGLRRVANYLLGDIVESTPTNVVVVGGAGEKTVVVTYRLAIEWNLDYPVGFGNMVPNKQVRVFGGVADCNESNSGFGKHASAVADSKAEGRALRKALCINVIAAEELMAGEDTEISGIPKMTSAITPALRTVIKSKCKALNLNLDDLIKEAKITNSADNLSMQDGQSLFEVINKHQQKS